MSQEKLTFETLVAELEQLAPRLTAAEAAKRDLEEELEGAREEAAYWQDEAEARAAQAAVVTPAGAENSATARLQEQIVALRKQVAALIGQVNGMTASRDAALAAVEPLNQQLAQLRAVRAELEEEVSFLSAELDEAGGALVKPAAPSAFLSTPWSTVPAATAAAPASTAATAFSAPSILPAAVAPPPPPTFGGDVPGDGFCYLTETLASISSAAAPPPAYGAVSAYGAYGGASSLATTPQVPYSAQIFLCVCLSLCMCVYLDLYIYMYIYIYMCV